MTLINYDSKCLKESTKKTMKIVRQCCKTAFVTLAQIWTNCIHKIFCFLVTLWHSSRDVVEKFIEKANKHHPTIKETFTRKWYLIQQQPLLNRIFKEPPIISYRKGFSLKDTRESKNITKARKPNHVFRSRVGLSTILTHSAFCFVITR